MDPTDSLRNLLLMAASDGKITESELQLLADRAVQWGITDEEFSAVLQEVISGTAELTLPQTPTDRQQFIEDMIRMMAADGHLAPEEKQLFAYASSVLGIDANEIDAMIDRVIKDG